MFESSNPLILGIALVIYKGIKITKSEYVKLQKQDREHHCHWPNCKIQVPPALFMCKPHWFKLPKYLRDKIWAAYVPGQEKTMTPSKAYLEAANEVEKWIIENGEIK